MIKSFLEIVEMFMIYWRYTYNETYKELESKYKLNNDPNNPNSPSSWASSDSCGGSD